MSKFWQKIRIVLATGSFAFWDDFFFDETNQLLPPAPGIGSDEFMNISNYTDAENFLIQLVNFALWFVGFIFLAVLVYGGFVYLSAGSQDEQAQKGQKIITAAIAGLILIFVSYAIVFTLISKFYLTSVAGNPGSLFN